jgi:hypothetical protein
VSIDRNSIDCVGRDAADTIQQLIVSFRDVARVTDHVSGMTDAFALAEYQRINAMGATLKWRQAAREGGETMDFDRCLATLLQRENNRGRTEVCH